jgi:HEAT repeat protein
MFCVARRRYGKRISLVTVILAFSAGIAGFWLLSEPIDKRVAHLLEELAGAPPARFARFRSLRSHEQIHADLHSLGRSTLPTLIAIVDHHPEPTIRYFAAVELGKVGSHSAVQPLIKLLKDSRGGVDRAAATALGQLGDRDAVGPLIGCLESENSSLRSCAAASLGKIGDQRAFKALAALAADKELCARVAAIRALGLLNDRRATKVLIACLQDESAWARQIAVAGLADLRAEEAIPTLRTACSDASDEVREKARLALFAAVRAQAMRRAGSAEFVLLDHEVQTAAK